MTLDLADPKVVRALSHPLRAKILLALDEGEASPVKLSARLNAPLGTVSYHVNILAELGLIKLVRTTPKRGAVEHHYRATPRPAASWEKWDRLPAAARGELARTAANDLGEALAGIAGAGGFDRRGAAVDRLSVRLDEAGWIELSRELRETSERVKAIERDCAKRLKDGADPIEAAVTLTLFELPGPAADKRR